MPTLTIEPTRFPAKSIAAAVSILIGSLIVVKLMGRPIWCDCGSLRPWVGDVTSTHESKHLVDPYSLSHFIYGLMLFAVLRHATPRLALG